MSRTLPTLALVGAALLLGACMEKPQTASGRKADAKAYEPAQNSAYVAPGWKAGDAGSWEEQTRQRAQAQNEYSRAAASGG